MQKHEKEPSHVQHVAHWSVFLFKKLHSLHELKERDFLQFGANLLVVEMIGRPGSQQTHAEFSACDLLLEGFDVRAQAKKLLGDGGNGSGPIRPHQPHA